MFAIPSRTSRAPGSGGPLHWARRFARDRRGVTIVEFALLAVPFFSLLGAIFELAFVYLSMQYVQSAVTAAARQLMTGQAQAKSQSVSSIAQFNSTYVCPQLPTYMDCSKLITDVQTAKSFSASDTSKTFYTGAAKYCPGLPGAVVVIRVVYPLSTIFPFSLTDLYVGLSNDVPNTPGWVHVLLGTAVVKNEPYAGNFVPTASC